MRVCICVPLISREPFTSQCNWTPGPESSSTSVDRRYAGCMEVDTTFDLSSLPCSQQVRTDVLRRQRRSVIASQSVFVSALPTYTSNNNVAPGNGSRAPVLPLCVSHWLTSAEGRCSSANNNVPTTTDTLWFLSVV